jgi:hypothetical protein
LKSQSSPLQRAFFAYFEAAFYVPGVFTQPQSKAGFTAIMAFMTAVERIAVIQSALVASSLGLESAIYSHKPKSDQDLKV